MDDAVLLIAEHSGRWEDCARSLRGPGRQLIVLAQPQGETAREFRGRVRDSLDRIRGRDVRLTRVILVAGTDATAHARPARAQLLSTLRGGLLDQGVELTQL